VVSSHSAVITKLAGKIKDILLSEPVDVIENDEQAIYECSTWELVAPRENGLTKIGSANLMICNHMVIKALHDAKDPQPLQNAKIVFETILTHLEAERYIRRPPHEKRKGFKVITND
jgi:hypothetical protein